MDKINARSVLSLLGVALLLGAVGCAARQTGAKTESSAAGMDASGEVIDSSLVEPGSGKTIQGIDDWEGETTGQSFPGSKFDQLKMGMSIQEVVQRLGEPNEFTTYMTGKAFIPYYFGSDQSRREMVYANQGRLVFAHEGGLSTTFHLIWIIYDKEQPGKL